MALTARICTRYGGRNVLHCPGMTHPTVAIVRYNAGNIRSVLNALARIGVTPVLTDDAEELRAADRIIFPGQGAASATMAYLRESGLDRLIPTLTRPVLGICIGQQLLCSHSAEGDVDCLGIFPNTPVVRFPQEAGLKVPHIGWNTVEDVQTPLFDGLKDGDFVYYVHSYYVPESPYAIAHTTYGGIRYSCAMRRGNFYATQFHPEKSGAVGERILSNFIRLCHD